MQLNVLNAYLDGRLAGIQELDAVFRQLGLQQTQVVLRSYVCGAIEINGSGVSCQAACRNKGPRPVSMRLFKKD